MSKVQKSEESMYRNGEKCPICGGGKLRKKTAKVSFDYKGTKCVVKDYVSYVCSACKEGIPDPSTLKRADRLLVDHRRKVEGLLASEEIKSIRLSLNMSQAELARELGVAEKTFTRYENGLVVQSRLADAYLRSLRLCPALLQHVKEDREAAAAYYVSGRDVWSAEVAQDYTYQQPSASVPDKGREANVKAA